MIRWFSFRHPSPTDRERPAFQGAHLAESTSHPIAPLCGAAGAIVEDPQPQPQGFVVACTVCLGLTEVDE